MKERGGLSRTGPDGDVLYPVDGTLYIGSAAECEVGVKDAAPRQCQIVRTPEGFVVHDLTGQKVTRVNGRRIERHLLREGDVVKIGAAEFRWTVTVEPEEEQILVVASIPVRRRPTAVVPAPVKPRSRAAMIASAVAAAIVLFGLLVFVFNRSSNADRSISRRDVRPARYESSAPSPGAVRETVPAEPPAPRQDPGGVVARPPEPARIVIEPLKPVLPEVSVAKPAPKAGARTPSPFELRYGALVASLERTLARGTGFEASYKEILECSTVGAPRGAADHLRALAASLKDAVACRECAGGKLLCERCQGKGRVDLDCTVCQGQGRVRASGAVGNADVTVKCRNCEGKKVFRGVTCPSCARGGKTVCPACRGKVWPSERCARAECKDGRVPCPQCAGRGWEVTKCPFCVNGRVKAPGAVGDADVTMKCRNCEVDGQQGNGTFRSDCKTCGRTGRLTCDSCGGAFGRKLVESVSRSVPASKVFTKERCAECAGDGCDRCLGLGSRIRPLSDPARVID